MFSEQPRTKLSAEEVTKGKLTSGVIARISRGDEALGEATVVSVNKGQQEAKEIIVREMCGLELETSQKIMLEEGDKLDFFTRESKARQL